MERKSGDTSGGGVYSGVGEERERVESGERLVCKEAGGFGQVGADGGRGHAIRRAYDGQSSGFLPPQAACVNGAQVSGEGMFPYFEFRRNPFGSGQSVGRAEFLFGGSSTFGLGSSSPNVGMHGFLGGDDGLGFSPYRKGGLGFGSFGRGGFGFSLFGGSDGGEGSRSRLSGSSAQPVMDSINGVFNGKFGPGFVNGDLVRCCSGGSKCMNSDQVSQKPGEASSRCKLGGDKTKGSESEEKILGSETAVVSEFGEANAGKELKRKRGRPKGSITMKKIVVGEGEAHARKKKVCGSGTAAVSESKLPESKKKIVGSETAVDSESGEATAGKELKRKRGRPKGSKNKKKIEVGEAHALKKNIYGSGTAVVSEYERSKSKKKILGSETAVDSESSEASAGKELKRKRGRPKGSKNKKKIVIGEIDAWKKKVCVSETAVVSESEGVESMKILGSETAVDSESGEANAGKELKRKPGRPKGSKTKKKIVVGETTVVVGSGGGQTGEDIWSGVKRKRGRPKGSKRETKIFNDGADSFAVLGEGDAGNHIERSLANKDAVACVTTSILRPVEGQEGNQIKRKVGRPKGSSKKINDEPQ